MEHVVEYLEALDLGQVVISSDGASGKAPFNRSRAYNRGAEVLADIYVWHEADMLVPRHQLVEGIRLAAQEPGLVVPFDTYCYLGEDDSMKVLEGAAPGFFKPERVMTDGRSIGAVGITSAATLQSVGQWDEMFSGWGYDDNAMAYAFQKAANPTRWVVGDAHHLWHTPGWQAGGRFAGGAEISDEEKAATERNRIRLGLYRQARSPLEIRRLTRGA